MTRSVARRYRIAHLHQPGGWLSPAYVEVNSAGTVVSVDATQPVHWRGPIERLDGYVLPGMVNLHSHAHQRALAGRTEFVGSDPTSSADDFWAWRSRMYALAGVLDPDQFQAIAARAYLEMLEAGYTSVGEFHYLHHDPTGKPYPNVTEMSERVVAAADQTGIGLTLLPVLYTHGGVGQAPTAGQRRFVFENVDDFLKLISDLQSRLSQFPYVRLGVAPHSVRAVSADNFTRLFDALPQLLPDGPIHIHVAEQTREVEECVAGLGAPPGRWLLDRFPVDARWTFIHATHCQRDELTELALRGATVGLCPVTEADLGDGLFPLVDYQQAGGRWGIGSDGNTVIDPTEELRLLEFGQRLTQRHRAILVSPRDVTTAHAGRLLFDLALAGGAHSLDHPVGAIQPGMRADWIELDPDHPALIGHSAETILDAWVFSGPSGAVRNVMAAGRWVVRDGQHVNTDAITRDFRHAMEEVAKAFGG